MAAMVAGSVLLYSGVTGRSILKSIQSVVSGKAPTTASVDYPIIGQNTGSGVTSDFAGGPAPNVSGGTYSKAQLVALWVSQGGNPAAGNVAAAVALAESGGRANAVNQNTNGSTDRGLWQINSVHGSQSTFDPAGNARAAISISGNGSNWSPWVTYTTGAYRRFL